MRAGYFGLSSDGSATVANVTTVSDLSLSDVYGELVVGVPIPGELISISGNLGLHALTGEATEKTTGLGEETVSSTVWLPTIGLHVGVNPIKQLGFEADIRGMDLSLGDQHGRLIEARGQAVYRPWENIGFIGGYRYAYYDLFIEAGGAKAAMDLIYPVLCRWIIPILNGPKIHNSHRIMPAMAL